MTDGDHALALLPRLALLPPAASSAALGSPPYAYLASLRSQKSQRSQASSLRVLSEALTGQRDCSRVPWHLLDWSNTNALRTWLCERYAPATVNRYLAALRGVLRACWRLRLMSLEDVERACGCDSLPSLGLGPSLTGRRLFPSELRALFELCDDGSRLGARDACVLALMVGCGLRAAELSMLTLADLAPASAGGDHMRVHGKGGKDRLAFAGPAVIRATAAWLKLRGYEPGPLVCRFQKGDSIVRPLLSVSTHSIWSLIRGRVKFAGLANAGPHDLRRTFFTSGLEAGVDHGTMAKLGGHANISTTVIYDRRGEGALRSAAALIPVPYGGAHG